MGITSPKRETEVTPAGPIPPREPAPEPTRAPAEPEKVPA